MTKRNNRDELDRPASEESDEPPAPAKKRAYKWGSSVKEWVKTPKTNHKLR
jgi:hypothetical protein